MFYGTPLPASAERNSSAQLVATAATPTSTDHSVRKHMQADSAGVTETCATAQTAHLITTIRVDLPGSSRANVLTAPLPTRGELWPWPMVLRTSDLARKIDSDRSGGIRIDGMKNERMLTMGSAGGCAVAQRGSAAIRMAFLL